VRLGLQDRYAHGASLPYLMKEYGLDAMALVRAVERLLNQSLDLADEDLASVRLETTRTADKIEDL